MTVIFDEDKAQKKYDEISNSEEEDLAQILSQRYGLPYVDLSQASINSDALRLIPEEDARNARVAIFDMTGKKLNIAILSPQKPDAMTLIRELESRNFIPSLFIASSKSLARAWDRYKDTKYTSETKAGSLDISSDEIKKMIGEIKGIPDVNAIISGILKEKKGFKISRILEVILAGAFGVEASDIHIEPEESSVRLRYRLDGVLQNAISFDRDTFFLILSRIKLLSGMKLNIKNSAQDGRFTVRLDEADIEIRSSMLPGAYSESIVLRILNPKAIQVTLEDLGFPPRLLNILLNEMKRPNGMILTTGPTGSGKTTTLYAVLRKIHTPEVKIITIEDPVEYHLPGIVQTQVDVKKGYTFASGLRASLRQDPDVIMVGEIRDPETAGTAIDASLTGHLVFSTLHTNNAAGAFPRLIDLDVNAKIISSAVRLAMAQRLVRTLCQKCKKQIPIPEDKKKFFEEALVGVTQEEMPTQKEMMYEAVGCPECNTTGYKGRIAVCEGILMDQTIENVIKENPSEREIKTASGHQKIIDMRQDGVIKILNGKTTLAELERVVDISTDIQSA
jgi:type IV pilus assembly protein PilB